MSKRFGRVAITGRPNVGKSTLINRLLGKKLCITSDKPQTTRHAILGLKTVGDVQMAYMDTPGLHQTVNKTMNKMMNRAAWRSLSGVDVVLFLLSGITWTDEETWILEKLRRIEIPVILVINKHDKIASQLDVGSKIAGFSEKMPFADCVLISAKTGYQVEELEARIASFMPEGEHVYEPELSTDRDDQFWSSEVIREKLTRTLGQELPYSLTVEIEQFEQKEAVLHISAIIWVSKPGQKAIVIGAKGERLKKVGTQARQDLEARFDSKIFLTLWVKVKSSWADDAKFLQQLGH